MSKEKSSLSFGQALFGVMKSSTETIEVAKQAAPPAQANESAAFAPSSPAPMLPATDNVVPVQFGSRQELETELANIRHQIVSGLDRLMDAALVQQQPQAELATPPTNDTSVHAEAPPETPVATWPATMAPEAAPAAHQETPPSFEAPEAPVATTPTAPLESAPAPTENGLPMVNPSFAAGSPFAPQGDEQPVAVDAPAAPATPEAPVFAPTPPAAVAPQEQPLAPIAPIAPVTEMEAAPQQQPQSVPTPEAQAPTPPEAQAPQPPKEEAFPTLRELLNSGTIQNRNEDESDQPAAPKAVLPSPRPAAEAPRVAAPAAPATVSMEAPAQAPASEPIQFQQPQQPVAQPAPAAYAPPAEQPQQPQQPVAEDIPGLAPFPGEAEPLAWPTPQRDAV